MAGDFADVSLFLHRVRDLIERAPVTCGESTLAVDLARLLTESGVGSVVVIGADGQPRGIVTDRDLRHMVAAGRDARATRAAAIMSAPLVSVPADAFAFEALLVMTRSGIHHLGVLEGQALVGVVSSRHFQLLETTHPVMLIRQITSASSTEALKALAGRVTALVSRLVHGGGSAYDVGQIVSELNDAIVARVLGLNEARLAREGLGTPPVPYAWLLFGSEARREQTLRTDQDNGLVYGDPPSELRDTAARYFARLAEATITELIALGVPRCPHDCMASNPEFRQPLAVWTERFRRWMTATAPGDVLAASIYFDVRALVASDPLGQALRGLVMAEAPSHRRLLTLLARDVVDRPLPLTLLGHVAVRRGGPQAGTVDLKGGGGLQLVGAGRLFALEAGDSETNTVDRLHHAARRRLYVDDEPGRVTDAFQHLMHLRLMHQLEQVAQGEAPDNLVRFERLSHADRVLLRDALKTVAWLQGGIRERFATDFAS